MELLNIIAQTIYDKKGFDILALDVRGICSMTDYFVFAEGSVNRHIKSIANALVEKLKEHRRSPLHIEGENDWLVLDYGDIVIHIFEPEFRAKYSLEEVWRDGKVVPLKIEIKRENQ